MTATTLHEHFLRSVRTGEMYRVGVAVREDGALLWSCTCPAAEYRPADADPTIAFCRHTKALKRLHDIGEL